MDRNLRRTAAALLLATVILAPAALPAEAAGPRDETAATVAPLPGWQELVAGLLGWLGLVEVGEPGPSRLSAASGGGTDPAGGDSMPGDGVEPSPQSGMGMDPNG